MGSLTMVARQAVGPWCTLGITLGRCAGVLESAGRWGLVVWVDPGGGLRVGCRPEVLS